MDIHRYIMWSSAREQNVVDIIRMHYFGTAYTVNVLSAESTDECLRTKSKDN